MELDLGPGSLFYNDINRETNEKLLQNTLLPRRKTVRSSETETHPHPLSSRSNTHTHKHIDRVQEDHILPFESDIAKENRE